MALTYVGELVGPQYRSKVFMWSGVMQAMSAAGHAGQLHPGGRRPGGLTDVSGQQRPIYAPVPVQMGLCCRDELGG